MKFEEFIDEEDRISVYEAIEQLEKFEQFMINNWAIEKNDRVEDLYRVDELPTFATLRALECTRKYIALKERYPQEIEKLEHDLNDF